MAIGEIEAASRDMAEVLLAYADGNDLLDDVMLEGAWVTGLAAPQQMGAALLTRVLKRCDADQDTQLLRRIWPICRECQGRCKTGKARGSSR
jgi:hypothetical protein